jgi:hypothetical protein
MDEVRTYRNTISTGHLKCYEVNVRETDLLVCTDINIYDITLDIVLNYRNYIENYIIENPLFLTSLVPVACDILAPAIIKDMISETQKVGVGPMASVAGAISQYVGSQLLDYSNNVIIENGGDNFIKTEHDVHISVYAGSSPLSEKIILKLRSSKMPAGICTSSGTIGHSLSFGRADAVCVLSDSAVLADAAATAIGNRVKNKNDIQKALEWGMAVDGVRGVVIIIGDAIGLLGNIELA